MLEIKDKTLCCGCSACVQKCPKQCISLVEDNEGFSYPKVDKQECIDCRLCDRVCPLQYEVKAVEPIKILAAYNKNATKRTECSSGGIFTLLAEKTILDGGVVFGARFNERWEVILDYTETMDGIKAFQGSKYVQASVEHAYKQCENFLKRNRQVLFSGTPCQIAGLNSFLGKNYDNLLNVDVVCHGVPSPMIWRMYLQKQISSFITAKKAVLKKGFVSLSQNCMSCIENIKFRDKFYGWKRFHFILDFTEVTSDSEQRFVSSINEPHDENLFMKAFLQDLILRPSCYNCKFRGKNKRQSDISIADYWGVQYVMPEMDDDRGTSLVLLNTQKGKLNYPYSLTLYKETDFSVAPIYNAGFRENIPVNPRRDSFFLAINRGHDLIKSLRIYVLPECQYVNIITPKYKKIIRKAKRIIYKMKHFCFVFYNSLIR